MHYHIGCVFVDDLHRLVTVGYNGAPRGDVNCDEAGCAKEAGGRCRGAHDVINAILNCIQPERLRGTTLYTTTFPCYDCMKALAQAGVKEIVYRDEYLRRVTSEVRAPEPEAAELAKRKGIEMRRCEARGDGG